MQVVDFQRAQGAQQVKAPCRGQSKPPATPVVMIEFKGIGVKKLAKILHENKLGTGN